MTIDPSFNTSVTSLWALKNEVGLAYKATSITCSYNPMLTTKPRMQERAPRPFERHLWTGLYRDNPLPLPPSPPLVKPRMPYFSYLSMLFFYETLGWWSGGAEVRKVHFAEVRMLSKTYNN